MRPWREKAADERSHAEVAGVSGKQIREMNQGFYTRRFRVIGEAVPESIRRAFLAQIATPPVRWKVGQTGTSIRVPDYAKRDLLASLSASTGL
ncbi:MAG: hypothetical protein ACLFR8_12960 [Alkalispirochaeta sp.]